MVARTSRSRSDSMVLMRRPYARITSIRPHATQSARCWCRSVAIRAEPDAIHPRAPGLLASHGMSGGAALPPPALGVARDLRHRLLVQREPDRAAYRRDDPEAQDDL